MSSENPSQEKTPLFSKVNIGLLLSSLQTPYKNSSNSQENKNTSTNFFSSGKVAHNLNRSPYRCFRSECQHCKKVNEEMKNLGCSPSSNYILHSPNSLECYLESYSREKLNVLKIVKRREDCEKNERYKDRKKHRKK